MPPPSSISDFSSQESPNISQENAVAEEVAKSPSPFDVRTIKSLVSLMTQHDLSEIDLRDGPQRLRLRRGASQTLVASTMPLLPAAPTAPSAVNSAPVKSEPTAPAASSKKLVEIKSPTPGTFYAASSPDAQPFVRVGSKVTSTTVVCLIEAMKLFNEINADCNGVIAEILVENQQAVEYGQVLFRVDPAG
jgi:acetyl-CoA carboxylase biotin carboxyl carrier protein